MKLARYYAGGELRIEEAPVPACPAGGLLVRTEACGLCSGELMTWYLDRKAPHVIGHEVAGIVVESEDSRFPVGCRVVPHHHAPCGNCELCRRGAFVHCPTWKSTRLVPGGMAEFFAVSAELLTDTHRADDLNPRDAALVEPLACVCKQIRRLGNPCGDSVAIVGLGVMGLLHMQLLEGAVGFDINEERVDRARRMGLDARENSLEHKFSNIVVMPGSEKAVEFALDIAAPDATIGLFAPLAPGAAPLHPWEDYYFNDIKWINSYSCGPNDTAEAISHIRAKRVKALDVVSDFIPLDALPMAYGKMQRGEILKAMVVFD
ncbi:MAG: alcohol dehydrogenase catalytic domain-containing protein [Fimbriimonadaceae bacterium]|nr:alcohol dehydrogenase catalytic domain-containing protein [Fimbriimonadaceae bacterium]